MADTLPLFPLQMAAFPGEEVPLHIFEPRYQQLIGECREDSITFGIVPVVENKLGSHGTEMELVQVFNEYEGGESDVLTRGVRAFELKRFIRTVPDKLYSAGEVEFIENDPVCDSTVQQMLWERFNELYSVLSSGHHFNEENPEYPSFFVGQNIGLTVEQKMELLARPNEGDRQRLLLRRIEKLIPIVKQAEAVKKRVRDNGHFKKFPIIEVDE